MVESALRVLLAIAIILVIAYVVWVVGLYILSAIGAPAIVATVFKIVLGVIALWSIFMQAKPVLNIP